MRVVLKSDWTATAASAEDLVYGLTSFGSGEGFSSGRIYVPYGVRVVFDLNGKIVNRNLNKEDPNGSVFCAQGNLTIEDSNPEVLHEAMTYHINRWEIGEVDMLGGVITGGYSVNGGGIYVSDYGAVRMLGGSIFGNRATANGGGVALMSFTEFDLRDGASVCCNSAAGNGGGVSADMCRIMISGGKISNNSGSNGGGIYSTGYEQTSETADGVFSYNFIEMTGGEISDNSADYGYGGGIYYAENFWSFITISGGAIIDNHARYGGGVYGMGNLAVSGSARIRDNDGNMTANIDLADGAYIRVVGSFKDGAYFVISNPDVEVREYDDFGFRSAEKNIDSGTGLPIDPDTFFGCDCGEDNEYHITRDQDNAGNTQGVSGTLRVTKYYVEWYVYDTTTVGEDPKGPVEYGDHIKTYDNVYSIIFQVTDNGSDDNKYRRGVKGRVYTLDTSGNKQYVTDEENASQATIRYPGHGSSYNYAPIISYGSIAIDYAYMASVRAGDETMWVLVDVTATSIEQAEVTVKISDEAKYYRFTLDRSNYVGTEAVTSSDFEVTVELDGKTLVRQSGNNSSVADYNVYVNDRSYAYVNAYETGELTITGINLYQGTVTCKFELLTNEKAHYKFASWQHGGDTVTSVTPEKPRTVIYSGADHAYEFSVNLTVLFDDDSVGVSEAPSRLDISQKGVVFDIYKRSGVDWALADEIVDAGNYKIVYNASKSLCPNAKIDGLQIPDLYVTVEPDVIDFENVIAGDKNVTLSDAVKVYFHSDRFERDVEVEFLSDGSAYVDSSEVKFVNGQTGGKYVYYLGEEFFVKLSDDLLIDYREIPQDGVTVTNSVTDTMGSFADVTKITTTIRIEFANYVNEDGENSIEFDFDWTIVSACNNVVDSEKRPYIPESEIEYGNSITAPYAYYGDCVVLEFTKGADLSSKVVIVRNKGEMSLYNYSDEIPDNLGEKIDSDFASYVASVVREGGKGEYTVIAHTTTYTDSVTGVVYAPAPQSYTFTVTARNIEANTDVEINVAGSTVYTGSRIEPYLIVFINGERGVEGKDYTVDWGENVNVGTDGGSATVVGTGVYEGSKTVNFNITPADNEWRVLRMPEWNHKAYDPSLNIIISQAAFGGENATYKIEKYVSDTQLEAVKGLEAFKINAKGEIVDKDGTLAEILDGLYGKHKLTATTETSANYSQAVASLDFDIVVLPTTYAVPQMNNLSVGVGKNDVYTGHVLSLSIQNFDPAGMTVALADGLEREGNVLYATDAGTYSVVITLVDPESRWGDGDDSMTRTFEWTIGKQKVAVPDYGTTSLVYNGKKQSYVPEGFDGSVMEMADNTETAAGVYTARVILKDPDNYEWENTAYGPEIPYRFEIEGPAKMFAIVISILAAVAVLAAAAILVQWIMHKQRLKVFAMANDRSDEKEDEGGANE